MQEAFHHGGWGMYPTTIFGVILILAASLYAWRPERSRLPMLRNLNWLVLLSGVLGFVTGVIKTLMTAGEQGGSQSIAMIGIGESLNNLALALAIMVAARIAMSVGAARGRVESGELVDPRAP